MYLGNRHARVRDERYDDADRRLRHRGDEAVPARDAALGGLRRLQRAARPGQVRRPGAARSTTTCRAPRRWCWPRRSPAVRGVRHPDARPAGGHPRRRHRRAGHRGHDARRRWSREGLSPEEATRRFWALGSRGLLTDDRAAPIRDFQVALRPPGRRGRRLGGPGRRAIGLAEVVAKVQPTMLIGTSTQTGAFTEAIVRDMAAAHRAADHHAAVQPDLEVRGAARRT